MNMFATIAAAPALVTATAAKAGSSRFKWDEAFAAMQEAERAYTALRAKYDAVYPSYEAGEPNLDMIDMKAGRFDFMDRRQVTFSLDLDAHSERFLSADGTTWWSQDPDAAKANFREAIEKVREWRRLDRANKDRHDWDGLNDRLDCAAEACSDAVEALIMTPAPDAEALLWKLEYLFGDEARGGIGAVQSVPGYSLDLIDPVLADARRLLSTGRA